jgi:hypothetical protein
VRKSDKSDLRVKPAGDRRSRRTTNQDELARQSPC